MLNRFKFDLPLLLCLFMQAAPPAFAQHTGAFYPPLVIPARPAHTVQFPKDYSLGQVFITENGRDENEGDKGVLVGAARGTVKVPANKILTLIGAAHLFTNPAIINTLPPDAIDYLKLNAASLDDSEDGLCDRALGFVGHLKGLASLSLDRSDATDAGLVHAAELPNLVRLSAFSTVVSGSCLKRISTLKKLNLLRLTYNNIKEENLQCLPAMTALQDLALGRTGISDVAMSYVAKCPKLVSLDISQNSRITDQSIKYILCLKKLHFLNLTGTKISALPLQQFKALPLEVLMLPAGRYKKAEYEAIKKAMPSVSLIMSGGVADKETKDLYAPLH